MIDPTKETRMNKLDPAARRAALFAAKAAEAKRIAEAARKQRAIDEWQHNREMHWEDRDLARGLR